MDEKWERAFERADRVREGFRRLLGDAAGHIALGANTHELVVRFLSALPLRERPRLVTTDAEFHTIRRQLDRLAEEGLEVVKVPAHPAGSVGERLAAAADERTAAALVSSVFYTTGHIAGGLEAAAAGCRHAGARLLVDAYHSLNVVPFSLDGLEDAFVVGGGYKYCQLGEGNCFLRFPADRELRPVITGWFSEFSALEGPAAGSGSSTADRAPAGEAADRASVAAGRRVTYGEGPDRFAGSTYDPTSHYRAAEVLAFFEEWDLTPDFLREVSRHQVRLLAEGFDELDPDPALIDRDRSVPLEAVGGFLALRASRAAELCRRLRARGVWTDWRGDLLRLGPAPYLSDRQLRDALAALAETLEEL